MSTEKVPSFNTVITTISMAVILWVGKTVYDSSRELGAITTAMSFSKDHESVQDVKLQELSVRVTALELDFARFKATHP